MPWRLINVRRTLPKPLTAQSHSIELFQKWSHPFQVVTVGRDALSSITICEHVRILAKHNITQPVANGLPDVPGWRQAISQPRCDCNFPDQREQEEFSSLRFSASVLKYAVSEMITSIPSCDSWQGRFVKHHYMRACASSGQAQHNSASGQWVACCAGLKTGYITAPLRLQLPRSKRAKRAFIPPLLG